MLKSQEVMLAQSKRRERMAALNKAEGDLSDDAVTELRSLSEQYEKGEVQYRAAVLTEETDRATIQTKDKAADDFDRECRAFSLSALIGAITEGKPLTGREAEVSAELETRNGPSQKGGVQVPWESLLETRADAVVTTATGEAGNMAPRPVMPPLERLFAESAAAKFGFRTVAVTGRPSWPEMVSGASAHWVAEGQGVDAEAIQTAIKTPNIHTVTARYLITRQAVRENPALESVLRRDLSGLIREAIDRAAFLGTGGLEPAGLLTQLTDAGRVMVAGANPSFGFLLSQAVQLMESAKLSSPKQVKVAGAPILLETMADDLVAGTAVSTWDRAQKTFGDLILSPQVSTTGARDATEHGASTVFFGAPDGLALIPTWGPPEIIVDPYSESKSGKIAITVFAFVDVLIQRLNTHFYAVTDVWGEGQ